MAQYFSLLNTLFSYLRLCKDGGEKGARPWESWSKETGAVKEHEGEIVLRLLESGKQGKQERLVIQI